MADYPQALDSDPDGVSTSLEVGASFWLRGDREEAVKWLRKAVDAAFDEGSDARGLELSKAAAALATETLSPPSMPKPAAMPEASSVSLSRSEPEVALSAAAPPGEASSAVAPPGEAPSAVAPPEIGRAHV